MNIRPFIFNLLVYETGDHIFSKSGKKKSKLPVFIFADGRKNMSTKNGIGPVSRIPGFSSTQGSLFSDFPLFPVNQNIKLILFELILVDVFKFSTFISRISWSAFWQMCVNKLCYISSK